MKQRILFLLTLSMCGFSFAQDDQNTPNTNASQDAQIAPNAIPSPAPSPTPTPSVTVPTQTPEPARSNKKSKSSNSNSTSSNSDDRIKIDEKGKIQMDFVNAEISDLAQSIGELTKRNFIIDDKVRGTITIISPQAITIEEAYQAFISALEVKGFAVTKVGKMNKIVPLREMNKLPIPTDVEFSMGGGDAFVTKLIPISHTRSSDIAKALRFFLTKNGDLVSYEPTNTLIITDSVSNLRRIERIISRLDSTGFQESVNILKLKYAPAVDVAEKIQKIFDLGSGTGIPAAVPPGADEGKGSFQYTSKVIPDERTNSLIIVSNAEGYQKISEIVKMIDKSLEDQIGSGRIHVHPLQYADATELTTTLSGVTAAASKKGTEKSKNVSQPVVPTTGATVGLLGGDVTIAADDQTNSLIITASANDYQSLIPVINQLDTRRPQAFVEAMILEVNIDKASELGVASNIANGFGDTDKVKGFAATSFGSTSSLFLPTTADAISGLVVGAQSRMIDIPLAGGETLSIPLFGGFFRALQTSGTVNVLSTPNILTLDNKEAEIIVGKKVPFISSQGRDINNQPINQIQREDVALTLRVKPQINSSDELTMDIFQEIQDIVPGADIETFGPTTSKRSTKTTVLVKNGQTITIGGLISDRVDTSTSKVPLLGDIPLIGWLFRNKSSSKSRLSLLMYLTPTIIRSPEDLETVTLRKNDERRNFLEKNRLKENQGVVGYGLNRDLKAPQPTPSDSPTSGFMSDESNKK